MATQKYKAEIMNFKDRYDIKTFEDDSLVRIRAKCVKYILNKTNRTWYECAISTTNPIQTIARIRYDFKDPTLLYQSYPVVEKVGMGRGPFSDYKVVKDGFLGRVDKNGKVSRKH